MLDSNEICADERNVINLPEHLDNTCVVDTRNEDSEKIGEERRLFLQVEREGFVVAEIMI